MKIKIANEVLQVGGIAELTAANSELFGEQICTALNGHKTIEVDLSGTKFMDCAGLGALIALRKFARGRNGVMLLVDPAPAVQQLFAVVGAGQMFDIVHTRATDLPQCPDPSAFSLSSLSRLAASPRQMAAQPEFA